jgi:hypothetical protein
MHFTPCTLLGALLECLFAVCLGVGRLHTVGQPTARFRGGIDVAVEAVSLRIFARVGAIELTIVTLALLLLLRFGLYYRFGVAVAVSTAGLALIHIVGSHRV